MEMPQVNGGVAVEASKKNVIVPPKNNVTLRSHAYDVIFINAGSATIIPDKPLPTYNNYFIDNDPKKWASGCRIFQAVTYKNVYPNIDVRYYTDNGKLKYDIIVQPGGNPQQIAMIFDGADDIKLKQGNLIIKTSVAEEKELAPYTFQPTYEGRKTINSSFQQKGNVVAFNIENYNTSIPLIIDPIKVFATFTGSTADNWGFTATYDKDGNFYAGGIVFGAGFPVSNGSTFQGGVNSKMVMYRHGYY